MSVVLPTTVNVSRPDAYGYGARLDDLLLRLSVTPDSPIEITVGRPEDRDAPLVRTERFPEDFTTEIGRRYTLGDISGGEGLYFAHRPERSEFDATRYWDSRGIDNIAPEPGAVVGARLLHATKVLYDDLPATSMANTSGFGGSELFYTAGTDKVYWVTGLPENASRATTDPDPGSGATAVSVVAIAAEVFAALGAAGIAKWSSSVWSKLVSAPTPAGALFTAKARLFCTHGPSGSQIFSEIDQTTGAATTVLTLPDGAVVTQVWGAGPVIMVGVSTGEIFLYSEASGTLTLQSRFRFPGSEWPTVILESFGVVLIGTAENVNTMAGQAIVGRLYRARLSDSLSYFSLVELELIRKFFTPETTSFSTGAFYPTAGCLRRDAAFVALYDPVNEVSQVWRYQFATGALNRDMEFAVFDSLPLALGVVSGILVAVISGTGGGIWVEDNTYVPSGYVISPLIDHYTGQEKAWSQLILDVNIAGSGGAIDFYVSVDPAALQDQAHASWILVGSIFVDHNGVGAPIPDIFGRYMAIKAVLRAPVTAAATPTLDSVTSVGYVATDEITVTLPVNVSDRVERRLRQPLTVPGLGLVALLAELIHREKQPAILELYRPALTLNGVIDTIRHSGPGIGSLSAGTLTARLIFIGRRNAAVSAPVGPTTLGLPTLGISKLGV